MKSGKTKVEFTEYAYNHITFVLTEKKIAFQVGTQFLILQAAEPYYYKRLKTIRLLIELGVITSIHDLAEHCKGKVKWVYSRREWL